MSLPKVNRLRHHKAFKTVYHQGGRCAGKYLVLRLLQETAFPNGEFPPPPQIGISVSQKVSKRAVIRNRIKRQIRGVFRELLPQLPPGWKIVVIVKPQAQECKYEDFLRELRKLLIKSEVLHGD